MFKGSFALLVRGNAHSIVRPPPPSSLPLSLFRHQWPMAHSRGPLMLGNSVVEQNHLKCWTADFQLKFLFWRNSLPQSHLLWNFWRSLPPPPRARIHQMPGATTAMAWQHRNPLRWTLATPWCLSLPPSIDRLLSPLPMTDTVCNRRYLNNISYSHYGSKSISGAIRKWDGLSYKVPHL